MLLSPQILVRRPPRLVSSGGAYTGPGDLATFAFWGGLRAYSAAKAAAQAACIDICSNSSGAPVNAQTINLLTSGAIDAATIATYIVANTTAYISKVYDQTGNGFDLTEVVNFPTYANSGVNVSGSQTLRNTSISQSQPFLLCGVALSNAGTNDSSGLWGAVSVDVRGTWRTTNAFGIYAGGAGVVQASGATTAALHALQGIYNGASSKANVDGGTDATGDIGTTGLTGGLVVGRDGSNVVFDGNWREIGLISGATAINSSVMSNMKTYWGIS